MLIKNQVSVAFIMILGPLIACGGDHFEAGPAPSSSASSANPTTSTSNSAPTASSSNPNPTLCPPEKPILNKQTKTCSWSPALFCMYKDDCSNPNYPFCYQGVCSDNDPIKKDPCTNNLEASMKGVCYDPLTDSANCGGYGRQCDDGSTCLAGFCSDSTCKGMSCPTGTPQCQKGKCLNLLSDEQNCGRINNVCAQNLPVCYLGRCVEKAPQLAITVGRRPKLELNIARLGQNHPPLLN